MEHIRGLQGEETKLNVSVACLSKEKSTLRARAGLVGVDTTGGSDGVGAGGGRNEIGEEELKVLVREKGARRGELESEKDLLQARCRELQVGRRMSNPTYSHMALYSPSQTIC